MKRKKEECRASERRGSEEVEVARTASRAEKVYFFLLEYSVPWVVGVGVV
jgi:hypothetical protein